MMSEKTFYYILIFLNIAKQNDSLQTKTLSNITRLLKSKVPLNNQIPSPSLLDEYKLEA